jgi:hypothetical protein
VAFCEAQDHAALSSPITADELLALQDSAPSGRILANYNEKRRDGDPDMPCILVEEPCPCWSAEELAAIDGNNTNGTGFLCDGSGEFIRAITEFQPLIFAQAIDEPAFQYCQYINSVTVTIRGFSDLAGTLTSEQAAECLAHVNAACDAAGL